MATRDWISGKEIMERWNIEGFQLYEYVIKGLMEGGVKVERVAE